VNKIKINIYVTRMSVTEIPPKVGLDDLAVVKTGIVHPDAVIKVWRVRGASTSGRFDQIQHAIQIAVQSCGLPVSALRNEKPSSKHKKASKREMESRARTASMFDDKGNE